MNVCADNARIRGNFIYNSSDSKITNKASGERVKSKQYSLEQKYHLDLSKTIYPYLTFDLGTFFEWDNSTTKTEGTKTDTERTLLRPYTRLTLNNPIYQGSLEYRRTQEEEKITGTPRMEDTRDTFESFLGWRPADLPRIILRYNQDHFYNHPKTRDQLRKLFLLRSDYTWRELRLNYIYTRDDNENRLQNTDTLEQTHLGRIEYFHGFLDGRLALNTAYKIRYNTLKVPSTGTAEVALQRTQGLFSLDSTPEDGPALAVNNALIDGNLTVSAGIDIGLAGDESTLTNIGLDFGLAVEVDQLRLWVDRNLTPEVADSFSWEVYTSPNNTNNSDWTLIATISPADFGIDFENRFTIDFARVNTRFIKVVTRPLDPTVSGAANFQNIFVTELQAFTIVSGATEDNEFTTFQQNFDLGLSARLSDKTSAGYNMTLTLREQDPNNRKTSQLTNDLYVSHKISRIFSASARVSRFDEDIDDQKTVQYDYSASLRGAYLPTFNQTLSFSGTSFKEEEDSSDQFSVVLRNNAILYPGWSFVLDSGFNWNRILGSDTKEKSVLLRVGTNVVPNNKLEFNLNYNARKTLKPANEIRSEFIFGAFWVPLTTLSLNATVRYIDQPGTNNTFQSYLVTWSPFPGGDLQFFFTYSEVLRSTDDQRQTTIGPGLNWRVRNHFFLEMFYNILRQNSNSQKVESNNFFANLRVIF